jgi:Domain of unknown function (DUF4806)
LPTEHGINFLESDDFHDKVYDIPEHDSSKIPKNPTIVPAEIEGELLTIQESELNIAIEQPLPVPECPDREIGSHPQDGEIAGPSGQILDVPIGNEDLRRLPHIVVARELGQDDVARLTLEHVLAARHTLKMHTATLLRLERKITNNSHGTGGDFKARLYTIIPVSTLEKFENLENLINEDDGRQNLMRYLQEQFPGPPNAKVMSYIIRMLFNEDFFLTKWNWSARSGKMALQSANLAQCILIRK